MAAWVKGDLPSPAPQATVPYAHQASSVMSAVRGLSVRHISIYFSTNWVIAQISDKSIDLLGLQAPHHVSLELCC